MSIAVELIPDPEQGGYTARLPDIPAYGEGESAEEAIADLREAIKGYIEAFGLDDALARRMESRRVCSRLNCPGQPAKRWSASSCGEASQWSGSPAATIFLSLAIRGPAFQFTATEF